MPVDRFRAVSGDFGDLYWLISKFLGTPNLPACNTGFAKLGQTELGSTVGMLFIFCTFTQQQVFNVPNFAKPKTVGGKQISEFLATVQYSFGRQILGQVILFGDIYFRLQTTSFCSLDSHFSLSDDKFLLVGQAIFTCGRQVFCS